ADPKVSRADRISLIEVVGQAKAPEGLAALRDLLDPKGDPAVQLAVLNALGTDGRPEVADALLERYPRLSESLRDRVRDLLCSRKDWAAKLLDAIASGRVAARDVRPAQAVQVAQHGDPTLTARLEKLWGRVPGPNSEGKAQRIAEVRGILPEG